MDKKPLIAYGWLRALIFILLVIPVSLACFWLTQKFLYTGAATPGVEPADESLLNFAIVYTTGAAGTFLLLFLFVKFIDKKSIKSLGFYWKGYENDAGIGFFTGVFLLALGTIMLITSGYLKFTGIAIEPQNLFISLILFVIVAAAEEVIFRGYVLHNLMQSLQPWLALAVSALLFGLFHYSNPEAGLLPILNVIAGGFLLGINYIYTRNLWFGIFLHFSWNFFQGPVFGYEVSGFNAGGVFVQSMDGPAWLTGAGFGFEGSAVALILVTLAVIFLHTYYYKKVAELKTSV